MMTPERIALVEWAVRYSRSEQHPEYTPLATEMLRALDELTGLRKTVNIMLDAIFRQPEVKPCDTPTAP